MKSSFIVCTRYNSKRIPGKIGVKINGKTILQHIDSRLRKCGVDIIYAIPFDEEDQYDFLFQDLDFEPKIYMGDARDPLKRMYAAAERYDVDNIIRFTHDKIFINPKDVYKCLDAFNSKNLDYLYSSSFTPGCGFEIISKRALKKASEKFKNIEHISYSIKAITDNKYNMPLDNHNPNYRLLIDFPEDVDAITTILSILGNDCTQEEVFKFLDENPWAISINKKPKVTIYTCAYNTGRFITECMHSVSSQINFRNLEYLLIDDKSTDKSSYKMSFFASQHPNVRYIRNNENLGLATSSNIALARARGEYIIRLDSDDYFSSQTSVKDLLEEIVSRDKDIIYPNNYLGRFGSVQSGDEHHHVGGAIFRTKAINHVKFTDGLRNLEGLDLWTRAKDQLNIGYLNKPTFFYRQRDDSMSKTNLEERQRIKKEILNGQIGLQ